MFDIRDPWCQVSIIANLGIVAGYLIVPLTALRLVPMRMQTRLAGMVFFGTCAVTHTYMAFASEHHPGRDWLSWVMLANHIVQAIAVWTFVLGLSAEVRMAVTVRRRRWNGPSAEVTGDRVPDPE